MYYVNYLFYILDMHSYLKGLLFLSPPFSYKLGGQYQQIVDIILDSMVLNQFFVKDCV
jgi:hypothetical protein